MLIISTAKVTFFSISATFFFSFTFFSIPTSATSSPLPILFHPKHELTNTPPCLTTWQFQQLTSKLQHYSVLQYDGGGDTDNCRVLARLACYLALGIGSQRTHLLHYKGQFDREAVMLTLLQQADGVTVLAVLALRIADILLTVGV